MKLPNLTALLLALSTILISLPTTAEIAVVVSSSSTIGEITPKIAKSIFLGKISEMEDGTKVMPIDQEAEEAPYAEFYLKIVKKKPEQLASYWSRRVFTGKGTPPKMVSDDDDVLELVSRNPNLIGYISAGAVDDTVKVILQVP